MDRGSWWASLGLQSPDLAREQLNACILGIFVHLSNTCSVCTMHASLSDWTFAHASACVCVCVCMYVYALSVTFLFHFCVTFSRLTFRIHDLVCIPLESHLWSCDSLKILSWFELKFPTHWAHYFAGSMPSALTVSFHSVLIFLLIFVWCSYRSFTSLWELCLRYLSLNKEVFMCFKYRCVSPSLVAFFSCILIANLILHKSQS